MIPDGKESVLPDDQDTAKGILSDLRREKAVHQIDVRGLLILHPFLKVIANEDDVVHAPAGFCEVGLEAGLAEIKLASLHDGGFILLDTWCMSASESSVAGDFESSYPQ